MVLYSPKTNLWEVVGRKLILGLIGSKSLMSEMCVWAAADRILVKVCVGRESSLLKGYLDTKYISHVNMFLNWNFCQVGLLGFGLRIIGLESGEKLAVALYSDMAYVDYIALSQKQGNGVKRQAKPKGVMGIEGPQVVCISLKGLK